MDSYILNLKSIIQTSSDISDYETFYTAVSQHIKISDNPSKFLDSVKECLKFFKDPYFISLTYRILSLIPSNNRIDKDTLLFHFKDRNIRDAILIYLSSMGITFMHKQIKKKLLKNPKNISKSLILFIQKNKIVCKDFMHRESKKILAKQLDIIRNCSVVYNLRYFFQFLGSESKIIAFKAFEAFCKVYDNNPILYTNLKIESANNFIKFAHN
jgi:hypothetical protein